LTVLDPVNLSDNRPDAAAGRALRKALARNPKWSVVPGDSAARTLKATGLSPDSACVEFQCAFDAGNALQTEFVLFGTSTTLPDLRAFTLDLVHVPTSQVVWTRVGEIPPGRAKGPAKRERNAAADSLVVEGSLPSVVAGLDPAALDLRKKPSSGSLGIMDAGRPSAHSRVALHRALSRAYASRAYDLLGPSEMEELLSALGIRGGSAASFPPTGPGAFAGFGGSGNMNATPYLHDDMLSLGSAMDVRYLLWTKVNHDGPGYAMDLALYDVAGRRTMRYWPAADTADFRSALRAEDRFLSVLGAEAPQPVPASPVASGNLKTVGKAVAIAMAAAVGVSFGVLAYQKKQSADSDYRRFQGAQSEQEAAQTREKVEDQDTEARAYGIAGGLSLALGAAVWAF
jgi:hypothetical protein